MGVIQIGNRISAKRKEKGITQEELANHLGVSKPAVSKWESGQSYPDILLLPVLASYFDITVDELIGYEPQLTQEEIRKVCRRLTGAFVKEPFEQVYAECETYVKKYFSCWRLQLEMGLLLLNHASFSGSEERAKEINLMVLEMFQRIEKNSDDVNLAKQALQLQALCYLSNQQPTEAIELLENLSTPMMQPEVLLVKAYQMKGDVDKALEYLQGIVYVNLMGIFGAAPDFFGLYAADPERIELFYQIFKNLSKTFDLEHLHPGILLNLHFSVACTYAGQDNKEKALDSLEYCLYLMNHNSRFYLKGNDIFDKLETFFTDMDVETEAPRKPEMIWKDLKNAILNHPVLQKLNEEERFKHMKAQLESI